uniref:Uncharacterized protein n=1 Tax=Timema genevievae TaxID=629358 RepID=A0A7R9PN20_TIMGE|nr:unnamed protein product [Timema genevievae]
MSLSTWTPAVAVMSTFLYTLLGLTVGSSLHCSVRREISPCTCRIQEPDTDTTVVACERMASFSQVVQALQYKFPPDADITLKIAYSQLEDLEGHSLQELGLAVTNLKLNQDNLRPVSNNYYSNNCNGRLEQSLKRLEQSLKMLEQSLKRLEQSLKRLEQSLKILEQSLKMLEQSLKRLEQSLKILEQHLKMLEQSLKMLEQSLKRCLQIVLGRGQLSLVRTNEELVE